MLGAFLRDPYDALPSRQTQRYSSRGEHKVREDIRREVGANLCLYPDGATGRETPPPGCGIAREDRTSRKNSSIALLFSSP